MTTNKRRKQIMKRPILIIASGVVVIALLLLVNEKWLKETSPSKTADKQQKVESVQQGSSPTEQRATDKPTSKPPVYDLSQKAHWYDPETTIGLYESKTLAEWLEPFKPSPQEFQLIAQFETTYKKLKESLSEDEYYSVERRKRLIDELSKQSNILQQQLGEEQMQFYLEVREPVTGYHKTWKVLTANGISEERVSEFRELADKFNQQMHGRPLYRADREVIRYSPEDFRISSDEKKRIAQTFRDRIEKEFGKQVLNDVLSLGGETFFMDQLDMGDNPTRYLGLMLDPNQQERLKSLYDVEFGNKEKMNKDIKEAERLEKREMELMEEWAKYHAQQQTEPEEASGDSP